MGNTFRLGFGGTYSIESPAPYSKEARGLIEELGIDVASYPKYHDGNLYRSLGLRSTIFFDKETFGVDRLVVGPASLRGGEKDAIPCLLIKNRWKQFLANAPLAAQAKSDLDRLRRDKQDYFPGLSSAEKKAKLARMSYATYLRDVVKVHEDVVKLYQAGPQPLFGLGIDAVPAQDAWGLDLPGFAGLKLDPAPGKGMNRDAIPNEEAEKYFFHFPDGNSSIARLLVRKLIPDTMARKHRLRCGSGQGQLFRLDASTSPVKIRLNSTAVRVKHLGNAATAKGVEVAYALRGGKVYTARRRRTASWRAGVAK